MPFLYYGALAVCYVPATQADLVAPYGGASLELAVAG